MYEDHAIPENLMELRLQRGMHFTFQERSNMSKLTESTFSREIL
jgi:hypothetical protein